MWGRGEGNLLKKVQLSPPPRPLLSPFQDFRLYRIPHPGLSSFVGTVLICLNARLVRLALIPPNAVNVTGILKSRGIDARRTRHKSHAQPCLCLYGNIPKMNTKKQRLCVRKRGKTLSQVPSRPFFPLEKELPEKNVTIFLFGFLLPYSVYITILFSQ